MCILLLKRERHASQRRTKRTMELIFLQLLETSELCKSRMLHQNIHTCAGLPRTETKYILKKKVEHDLEKWTENKSQEVFNLPLLFDELVKRGRNCCLELNIFFFSTSTGDWSMASLGKHEMYLRTTSAAAKNSLWDVEKVCTNRVKACRFNKLWFVMHELFVLTKWFLYGKHAIDAPCIRICSLLPSIRCNQVFGCTLVSLWYAWCDTVWDNNMHDVGGLLNYWHSFCVGIRWWRRWGCRNQPLVCRARGKEKVIDLWLLS